MVIVIIAYNIEKLNLEWTFTVNVIKHPLRVCTESLIPNGIKYKTGRETLFFF